MWKFSSQRSTSASQCDHHLLLYHPPLHCVSLLLCFCFASLWTKLRSGCTHITTSICDDIAYDTREIDNRRRDDSVATRRLRAAGCRKTAYVEKTGPLELAAAIFIDPMEHAQNTGATWSWRFELWRSGVRRRGGPTFVVGNTALSLLGLTDQLTDWLTDRLTDWLTDSLTDRLTNRLNVWPTDWLTDWLTDSLTDRLIDWPTDQQTDRLTDWLTDRLTNRLTVWPTDWPTPWPQGSLFSSYRIMITFHYYQAALPQNRRSWSSYNIFGPRACYMHRLCKPSLSEKYNNNNNNNFAV